MCSCNIKYTYIDEYDPWSVILVVTASILISTKNRLKGYSLNQLLFDYDMIIPIKHTEGWELIRQQNQTKINKDNIRENRNRVVHYYKVGDKFILKNHSAYKYETPYKGTFLIARCFTNGALNIQYGMIKIRHNIRRIKSYKYDTNVEGIYPGKFCDDFNIW